MRVEKGKEIMYICCTQLHAPKGQPPTRETCCLGWTHPSDCWRWLGAPRCSCVRACSAMPPPGARSGVRQKGGVQRLPPGPPLARLAAQNRPKPQPGRPAQGGEVVGGRGAGQRSGGRHSRAASGPAQ